ncbi:MAG: zraS, partial [Sedimentibacter sp.]|nr:zraS [Sedimentibacter sp.]
NYICKENNWIDQIKIVGKTLNEQKYSMAVSKNNPQLLRKLNEGLDEIRNNGMYDALHRKWFGTPIKNSSKEMEGQIIILLFSLFILLLIILTVQMINRKLNRIIEEKTREEKILINELRNYDKLQFMDKIISSLAHEIRNPLTSVKIYTTQMKNKLENKEFMLAAAEDIPEEIDRIDALIKEFMEYTSPRKPQIKVLNLKNEIENTIKFIKLQIRDIYVDLKVPEDIYIEFDLSHFKQIVINVMLNSKDALVGTDNPIIKINGYCDGENVNIEFEDNGCGMDEKSLDYIFEPFYTTKDNGNGVGMFIVKKLVEENGGEIDARNNENSSGLVVFLKVRMGVRNEN